MASLGILEVLDPDLPIARYWLTFRAEKPLPQTGYRGSAWRGVFGWALKNLVCVTREQACPDCLLYRSCIYPYVFETPLDEAQALLGKTGFAPHPFVLVVNPGGQASDSAEEKIALTLFGRANQYLPYVVHALRKAGEKGLKCVGQSLELISVEQEIVDPKSAACQNSIGGGAMRAIYHPPNRLSPEPPSVPACPEPPTTARIVFLTPLRIRRQEDLVTPAAFRFEDLLVNLLRRISLLMYYHADRRLAVDYVARCEASREVEWVAKDLGWREWTRYSGRQRTRMQMGGLLGWVEYRAARWPELWPYVWLGQWTHAGKATSMGLGRYRIEMLD